MLRIVPDAPAAAAGLQVADVITTVNGRTVDTVEAFLGALCGHDPGETLRVRIMRGGEESEVK